MLLVLDKLAGKLTACATTACATKRPRSSGVERLLGKEEVMSSNLIAGSIIVARTS